MKKENIIPRDEQGKAHGYCEKYHPNGNLMYRGTFIHGKKYGLFEKYYSNGQLELKGVHVNDKEYGLFELYSNDGEILSKRTFLNGVEQGYFENYSCYNGVSFLSMSGYHFHGVLHGNCKYYFPDSKLSSEGNYLYGEKHGYHEYYFLKKTPITKLYGEIYYMGDKIYFTKKSKMIL